MSIQEATLATPTKHLYRTDAIDTSVKAAESVDVNRLESLVLAVIRGAGRRGITQGELLGIFDNYAYSSITARPSALKRKGLVVDSGERRVGASGRGQAVLIAKEYAR